MSKLENVIAKPSLPLFLRNLPILRTLFYETAQGIYPYILVPKQIFDNLNSTNPNPYHLSLVVHEQTHLDRQTELGWLKWMISYVFNAKFRFNEELIANKMQMKFMKKNNLQFPFDMKAKMLSSWVYLWPISYKTALSELKSTWKNV